MRLALALTSAQADRLRKEADRLGIAPAVLARATLEDLCDLPDAGFRAAAERIVPKNQELSLASPDAVSDACRDPRAAPRDAGAVRWHAGHSRSGCPARCAGPAAPPWRPFSRCMVSASRRHAGISGLNATRLVWLRLATRVATARARRDRPGRPPARPRGLMATTASAPPGPGARASRLRRFHRPPDRRRVLPSSSVGEESLSPNHPDTSSRF